MAVPDFSIVGRVAMVTGASSGLGAHFAKILAQAGAKVVLAARRTDKLQALQQELESAGYTAMTVAMDVASRESVSAACAQAEQGFGTIDILINNAGVADTAYFLDLTEDSWDKVMDTNVKGVWLVASEVGRRLKASDQAGSIINIASVLGLRVQNMQSAYAASKAAVVHLTHSMASELSRFNIRVNAIAPGYFKTEMNEDFFNTEKGMEYIRRTPARRLGEYPELSGALLLLASDAGSFINGVILPIDGGHMWQGL